MPWATLWSRALGNLRAATCSTRVSVPITADRKSKWLLKIEKKILGWKSRHELIFKAVFGIKEVECSP